TQSAPYRVRVFQLPRGEGLVHQDAAWRFRIVPRVKEPSSAQLRADCGEISRRGGANFGTRFFALLEGGLAHDLEKAPVVAANHRRHIDPAHAGHAGQCLDALYQLLEEIAAALFIA